MTLPTDFDIFSPRLNRKPWTTICLGSGRSADSRKAGQKMAWKRVMSLPITWASQGQNLALGPPCPEKAGGGKVIGERVHPDIHDVLVVARNLDAPIKRGAADRQVVQPALHEGDDLVLVLFRRDEVGMRLVMGEQPVRIGRELEEIALLLHPFDRRARGREFFPVIFGEFALVIIGFVAHRIPAAVFRQVNIALGGHAPPDLLHRFRMARLRGADDVVGAGIELFAHGLELRGGAVGELLRRQTFARRRLLHFQPVLVHAGDEQHVLAVEPLESGEGVGGDALVGVADMRRAIGVGNGGRDVIGVFFGHACRP